LTCSERDFRKAVSKKKLNLIAEIKRKSPSQNMTNNGFDIKEIVKIYDKYADAISVLTDKKFFDGDLEDMETVSKLSGLPILRKDFIIDEYQIYESRLHSADAILLIASVLPNGRLNDFINLAKSYGMDCLVEISNEEELKKVLGSGADIIGINNRNLSTLKIDTETTINLMSMIPNGRIVVSESGISSREYLRKISGKVNAVLVGTFFMNSGDLEMGIKSLIK
jgi:indole-3-glycerol phosphate synthase